MNKIKNFNHQIFVPLNLSDQWHKQICPAMVYTLPWTGNTQQTNCMLVMPLGRYDIQAGGEGGQVRHHHDFFSVIPFSSFLPFFV